MFLSCEDSVTARGMRILYSPLPGDERIVSGNQFSGLLWIMFVDVDVKENLGQFVLDLCTPS